MYGIEYSALADLYLKEEENVEKINDALAVNNTPGKKSLKSKNDNQIKVKQKLLDKLNSLKDCPDYLLPKFFSSTGTGTGSGATATSSTHASETKKTKPNEDTSKSIAKPIYYTDDFILLSEFSEIEGPKPLLTIPTDGGTVFNKNEYSLRLMCVDFHSHLQPQKISEFSSSSNESAENDNLSNACQISKTFSKFSLTKDTSIINYWDSNSTVSACVHHFTLYDLSARGFVRPFCLAYISYEKNKPISFFEQLREKFAEITDLLKKSNFNLFKNELEQRCLDLKFTRDLFLKWSNESNSDSTSNTTDQDKLDNRLKLAKDFKIDNKTFARLNASCANEHIKNLQLNAIDNLLNEMENVLSVINYELKLKNWHIVANKPPKHKLSSNLLVAANEIESVDTFKKSSSAIDPILLKEVDSKERAFTYPAELSISVGKDKNSEIKSNNKAKEKYSLRKPKLIKNVLIGNTNLTSNNGFAGIDYLNIDSQNNQFEMTKDQNQTKIMKRFHQLCSETAKQAINELRLMQRYFSTPYHLLKFKEITNMGGNEIFANKNKLKKNSNNYNLFWSITLGNCLIADFSTNIDTLNLNKCALIKKSNFFNRNVKIANVSKFNKKETNSTKNGTNINEGDNQRFVYIIKDQSNKDNYEPTSNESSSTQFYSPVPEKNVISPTDRNQNLKSENLFEANSFEAASNLFNSNSNSGLKKIIADDSVASWKKVEEYLNFDEEEIAENENEEFYSDVSNKTTDENSMNEKKQPNTITLQYQQNNERELNDYLNDDNNKWNVDEYEDYDDENKSNTSEKTNMPKEENEYDFANSLLTLEYKPFNQYSNNFDYNGIYLSSSSLSLSLNSLSISIYYSTLNRFKYQSTITDKLIQISEFNFEETLKKLMINYAGIFPHLLYSLLKGRPIVFITRYCNDLAYLTSVLDCLSNFIPNSFYCLNELTTQSNLVMNNNSPKKHQSISPKFTSSPCNQFTFDNKSNTYNKTSTNNNDQFQTRPLLRAIFERKSIKLNDLKYCKLIGLNLMIPKDGQCCSVDCNEKQISTNTYIHQHKHYHLSKTQDDNDLLLRYVPITIRNYVSIFDLDKGTFNGPKYKGYYLNNCINKCRQLPQDSICYLYLLAHVVKYYVKVAFLYNYSILFDSGEKVYNESKFRQRSISNIQPIKISHISNKLNESNEDNSLINSLSSSKTVLDQFSQSDQLKKERVLRYYSIDYPNNNLNDTSSYSLTSSLTSIASAIIGGGSDNKNYKQLRRHSNNQKATSYEDIDLLRAILANVTSSFNHNANVNVNTDNESISNFSMENASIITTNSNSLTSNNNNNSNNSTSFDDSDLNIVIYILKSLKIKQIYLYNLALQKKKLREIKKLIKELNSNETKSSTFDNETNTEISAGSSTQHFNQHSLQTDNNMDKKEYLNLLKEQKLFLNAQIHSNIQLPLLIEYEELTLFHSKK